MGRSRPKKENYMTTPAVSTSRYTPAMEDMIRAAAPINNDIATQLAEAFGPGFTNKSVAAKATRMGVEYQRKVAVSKTGAPVEKKETIVEQIEALMETSLEGLEKAPKQALQNVRDFIVASLETE